MNTFRTLNHKEGLEDEPLVDNFRPVQKLGSRTVYSSSKPKCDGKTCGAGGLKSGTLTLAIVAIFILYQSQQ